MKALKVGLVISAVVLLSIACSTPAGNSNGGANQNSADVVSSQSQNGNAAAGGTAVNANAAGGANANTTIAASGTPGGATGIDAAALFNGGVTPKCSGCHGEDGKGKLKGTPDFTSQIWQDKKSNDDLIEAIIEGEDGGKKMPAFRSKLTDEQIKALVGYVRSFAKR